LGQCRAAGELRAEGVAALAAADLAGDGLRVWTSVGSDVAGVDPAYEAHERRLTAEAREKLLGASARTLDRLLEPLRVKGAAAR